jgi:hypothetical protein
LTPFFEYNAISIYELIYFQGSGLVVLFHCNSRLAVGTIVAFRIGLRDSRTVQAIIDFVNGALYPGVAPRVGNNGYLKLQPPIKNLFIAIAVAVDEVAGIRNFMAVFSKEPLVDFHLALVAIVPGFVELNYVFLFAGGLVVDHYVLCLRVFPEIVDGAEDQEIGRLMEVLDTGEVVTPNVEILMRYGNGVDAVLFHERMSGPFGSMNVELFFQENINGRVQGERESGRSADPKPAIHVKAAWAILKKVDFAPA